MTTWTIHTDTAGTFTVHASGRNQAYRTAFDLLESWGYPNARILAVA